MLHLGLTISFVVYSVHTKVDAEWENLKQVFFFAQYTFTCFIFGWVLKLMQNVIVTHKLIAYKIHCALILSKQARSSVTIRLHGANILRTSTSSEKFFIVLY